MKRITQKSFSRCLSLNLSFFDIIQTQGIYIYMNIYIKCVINYSTCPSRRCEVASDTVTVQRAAAATARLSLSSWIKERTSFWSKTQTIFTYSGVGTLHLREWFTAAKKNKQNIYIYIGIMIIIKNKNNKNNNDDNSTHPSCLLVQYEWIVCHHNRPNLFSHHNSRTRIAELCSV